MNQKNNKKDKLRSCVKTKDGWWASIFAGPLANRLLEPICELSWLTPNQLTVFSFFIGLIAAYFFAKGDYVSLVIGGFLVQLSFVVDCMDGQFARYSKKFSDFGAWLDRISDRLKDFAYFFTLAWGFFHSHPEHFQYGLTSFVNVVSKFISVEQYFNLDPMLHMLTMQGAELESWTVFPIAMIAMFSIFLIDYYVNQDMKFPTAASLRGQSPKQSFDEEIAASPSAPRNDSPLKNILKLGLQVYRSIPILRFNLGEQALLITIFCFFGAVFSLLSFFALLGSFYVIYWPFAKYYGFTESK